MNGFELAGRPIRVGLGNDKFTPETTQSLLQKFGSQGQGGKDAEKTGGASALDDTDVAGVNFSNYSRDALMRKLARTEDTEPKPAAKAQQKKAPVDEAAPSRCVLLKNLYTEKE
jgi:RNA-binding protein 39